MPNLLPIPRLTEPPDWARLTIEECGEPLVPLIPGEGKIRVHSIYAELGIPDAPTETRVRAGVRTRLLWAAQSLPKEIGLTVFDGYRPLRVQQYLWDGYYAQVRATHPEWSEEEVKLGVSEFVAKPSADPTCPPPHRSGGAVDVYLVSLATGEPLPMGTAPDETSPASVTRYYEEHPEEPFTTNRRILFHAMTGAGFTNYRGEWWHYDYGNQRWANCSGLECAIYGIPPE